MSSASPSSASPVLVTGGSGFIGSHAVWQLLDRGYRVRATVRDLNSPKVDFLKAVHPKAGEALELVPGDLTDASCWGAAVRGCQAVLHIASPVTMHPANESDVLLPAVNGTKHVLRAAGRAGVKRVVVTSSVVAMIAGHPATRYLSGSPKFDQHDWSEVAELKNYNKAKTLAEKEAWTLAANEGLDLTTIQPPLVCGPLLSKQHADNDAAAQVLKLMRRDYPVLPDICMPFVDVRDVAAAHIAAIERPATKVCFQRFPLAADDGNITILEQSAILNDMFGQYGFCPPTVLLPSWLVRFGAFFSRDMQAAAEYVGKHITICTRNARRRLKIDFRPIATTFRDTVLSCVQLELLVRNSIPQIEVEEFHPYKPLPQC